MIRIFVVMQNIRFLNRVILSLLNETDLEYKSFFNVKELYLNTPIFVYTGDRIYGRYFFLAIDLFDSMGCYKHLPGHLKRVYGLVQYEDDGFDEITYVINTYYSIIMEMPEVRKIIIKKYPGYYPPNHKGYRYKQLVKELESNSL